MIGAGTFINPLLKIVTVVAVLGASYIFIVEPILDTTEDVTSQAFESFGPGFDSLNDLPDQVQGNIDQTLEATDSSQQASRFQRCLRAAIGAQTPPDQTRIQRCVERFSP